MTDLAGEYHSDPSLRKVQIGIETAHFITNDKIGKYLIERAHAARIAALEELAEMPVCAANLEKLSSLQWKARIPDLFLQWLDDAIAEGRAAEDAIKWEDATE